MKAKDQFEATMMMFLKSLKAIPELKNPYVCIAIAFDEDAPFVKTLGVNAVCMVNEKGLHDRAIQIIEHDKNHKKNKLDFEKNI